jgi:hypothetical protein
MEAQRGGAGVTVPEGAHRELMLRAIASEGDGHRAALRGEHEPARLAYEEAASLYRASWEVAPPASFGRLEGMLKAAVLAGDAGEAAAYVRAQIPDADDLSPPAAYALAVAALVLGDDDEAARRAEAMRAGSPAFGRAADANAALAAGDGAAYRAALQAIVDDFAGRDEHLTGVAIADTAAMLEALAAPRGLAADLSSPLLPR